MSDVHVDRVKMDCAKDVAISLCKLVGKQAVMVTAGDKAYKVTVEETEAVAEIPISDGDKFVMVYDVMKMLDSMVCAGAKHDYASEQVVKRASDYLRELDQKYMRSYKGFEELIAEMRARLDKALAVVSIQKEVLAGTEMVLNVENGKLYEEVLAMIPKK